MEIVISIDIGGTSTKLALVHLKTGILEKTAVPSQGYKSQKRYFEKLFEEIATLQSRLDFSYTLLGIGIGTPACNTKKGTIEGAANLAFLNDVPIVQLFEEKYKLPVFLINDGNAAALGEGLFGAAKGMKDYIVLTLGTGFGCGIVTSGIVLQGASGKAGEFGHIVVRKNGRKCGCGSKGCLDTYVSASGIKRTVYKLLADLRLESRLRSISFDQLSPKMIYEAALEDDKIALKAFNYTGKILGQKIADLYTIFEPEAIFLSGGLSSAGNILLEPVLKTARQHVMPFYQSKIAISPSALALNEAALLGAASLVWKSNH